jgi:hypothetical protein
MTELSAWRAVQEALFQRFKARWVVLGQPISPIQYGNETFDPPDGRWVKLNPQRRPGSPGTIGRPGNRKMDRAGSLFILLREPAGNGVGDLSDLAEYAAKIFEGCRLPTYDLRFNEVEPLGDAAEIEGGRWWGVTVEARFVYEQIV